MEAKLFKEKNKNGEVVSVIVTIERDSAYEKRRFGSEKEARDFIRRLKELEAQKK
jgi:hypothetical protein